MNEDIKGRWVAALRSGKYTQGQEALHADGKFCCLGVLCDILKDELGLKVEAGDGIAEYRYGIQGATGVLPDEVVTAAGLDDEDPLLEGNTSAAGLNDSGEFDFPAIAALIEANL